MPRLRTAEWALTLLASSSSTPSQQYICRTCRLHALRTLHTTAVRSLHTTSPSLAEESFLSRIKNSVFGSKESKEASKRREEARAKRVQELSQQSAEERGSGTERFVDREGRQWEVAALVNESLDREYVPAQTWEGLERIGGEEWVRRRGDGGEVYYGFSLPIKIGLNDEEWKRLLHHVAVEVLALHQAGQNVDHICHQRSWPNGWKNTKDVSIVVDGNGVNLTSTGDVTIDHILGGIPETAQEPGPGTAEVLRIEAESAAGKIDPTQAEIAQSDDSWMQMSLTDPVVKLAILKRTTQLTGHRPRDTAISSPTLTLADLYAAFKTKEKPKKLAHSDKMAALNNEYPNVTVHTSRRTPIHEHREVGRWKLIKEELEARDLPVTGSRFGKDARTKSGLGLEKTSQKKGRKAKRNA